MPVSITSVIDNKLTDLTPDQRKQAKMIASNYNDIDVARMAWQKWNKGYKRYDLRSSRATRTSAMDPIPQPSKKYGDAPRLYTIAERASMLSSAQFNPKEETQWPAEPARRLEDIVATAAARAPTDLYERPQCNKRSGCSMMGGRYKRSTKRRIKRCKMSRKRRYRRR
jgi:hypothetical protein